MEKRTEQVSSAGATETGPDFSQMLKASFKPRTRDVEEEVEKGISTLVTQALQDQSVISDDVLDTVDAMIMALDRKISAQMNEILHHPDFQQVEGAWRGLEYCVTNSEPDATLKIKVMNVSLTELQQDARDSRGGKFDNSPTFKKVYEAGLGTLGGEPFGCLVGDFQFDQSPPSVTVLKHLAKIASASHSPFFSSASPALLGRDSWTELPQIYDVGEVFENKEYAQWKTFRESEDARYVGLCLPRVLSREPYGPNTLPVEAFNFEEETDGHAGSKYAWMNAAYAMAANVARAHKDYGWTVQIRGVQSGGEVINLPVHTFETEEGDTDLKCPTEVSITARREAELSKAGLIPLVHRQNTDKAAFIGAQSVYKPRQFADPDATASDNLSSRIPYMFAVSRFAHYLNHMIRDKIGSTHEREQLQRDLQNWITQYVHLSPSNASDADKAKRPLAAAEVKIVEDPENPGYYLGNFYLRPHFQLEGMDIGMSLVSKLPS